MQTATINHFSKVGKLDGIRSWSLQAIDTCPAAKTASGELVDACKGCYATTGQYNFPNVRKPRADNRIAWQQPDWVDIMVSAIEKESHFRFFDSGDGYKRELWDKIYEIAVRCPNTKIWVPTRMYKFSGFRSIIDKLNSLPNVIVRFSSDSILGEYTKGLHGSVIFPEGFKDPYVYQCPATLNHGKCDGCRECWNKEQEIIGYKQHGKKMNKVYRNLIK